MNKRRGLAAPQGPEAAVVGGPQRASTGGHAGIGLEVSPVLAKPGASVTVGSRDPERVAAALRAVERAEVGQLDLIDPGLIDTFAARWLAHGRPLHISVNGAGASGGPERDARGYEMQFVTTHLGHFQLTGALLPALRAAIAVSNARTSLVAYTGPMPQIMPEPGIFLLPSNVVGSSPGGMRP